MAGVEAIDLHPPDWDRNYGDLDELEEDEDEPNVLPPPIFAWSPVGRSKIQGGQLSCKTLLISLGSHASVFVTGHTAAPIVGGILLPEADLLECNTISDPTCLSCPGGILTMHQDTVILRQPRHITDDARSFDWVESVFRHVAPSRVIVLCTLSEGLFHGANSGQPPFLRCLQSTHEAAELKKVCPQLEIPNLIAGTGAAILSHCEVFGLAATMFVSVDSLHSPENTVAAFEPVLAVLPVLSQRKPVDYAALLSACQLRRSALTIKSTLPDSIYL